MGVLDGAEGDPAFLNKSAEVSILSLNCTDSVKYILYSSA
jgi:hypothetical protein